MRKRLLPSLLFVLALLGALLSLSAPAHAQSATPSASSGAAGAAPSATSGVDANRHFSLGARGFAWYAPRQSGVSTAGGGVGLDFTYALNPYFAIGAQQTGFQALGPAEYHPLQIASGRSTLALAEVRYPVLPFLAPYARGELGITHLELHSEYPAFSETHDAFSLGGELGIELHYHASLRLFADVLTNPAVSVASPMTGLGIQLGARF